MIDFLCIGAQKSGTSWLYKNLGQHPNIWMPFIKEVHYFDTVYLDYDAEHHLKVIRGNIERLKNHPDFHELADYYNKIQDPDHAFTEEWYEHIFSLAPPGKLKGEITPYYSSLTLDGIRHVRRLAPNAKIIYLIRDPIERAKSSLRMALGKNNKNQLDICKREDFLSRGDYRANIPRWISCYGKENILFLPFGQIKSNPDMLLKQIALFLDITQEYQFSDLSKSVHKSKPFLCQQLV